VRLMGRCVLWAGASYRPVRLIGRCVLWAGASYGPGNTVYHASVDDVYRSKCSLFWNTNTTLKCACGPNEKFL